MTLVGSIPRIAHSDAVDDQLLGHLVADLRAAVRVARRHGRPFVARGSGTGLAGGATPLDNPVVIVTTQMNRVLEIDAEARVAWVEPGVLNLDLTRAVSHLGLHYSPDPAHSSPTRRATTCADASSARRARWGSPRGSRFASCPTRLVSPRCCARS